MNTTTLAELMRRLGVPFDINPFVNAYMQQGRRRRRPGMQQPAQPQQPFQQQMQQRMQQMPLLAMLARRQ